MLKAFKYTALLEGVSYLVLLANMLIIKPNNLDLYKTLLKPIGMAHGILFILYVILAFLLKEEKNWNKKDFAIILGASLLPFGTFYIDSKYLKSTK